MKILIHCCHFASCSGRNITEAFRRLGHEVRHTGPEMGCELWGLQVPPAYVWTPDAEPADGWIPDLCILADTAYQWHYADESVPTIVWSVDNHVRDLLQKGIAHYFLAHRLVSQMPWIKPHIPNGHITTDPDDMTHLPCAFDPPLHTPSPIPWSDRKYDVCMLGVLQGYPRRQAILKAIIEAGYKVKWGAGLIAENYSAAYQDSRIALCVSFNGDVGQRVFEGAAMGCVVLTDNCADFALLKPDGFYLPDGGDMLTPENAVIAVQDILADPARAQANIEMSLAWVKPHNWDARAQVIVDWYQKAYPLDTLKTFSEMAHRVMTLPWETPEQLPVTVAGIGEVWEAAGVPVDLDYGEQDGGFDDGLDDFPDEYEGDE